MNHSVAYFIGSIESRQEAIRIADSQLIDAGHAIETSDLKYVDGADTSQNAII